MFSINGSNSKVKVTVSKIVLSKKGLITSNTHVKYQSSSTHCLKVISKVKVFEKWDKLQGQGHSGARSHGLGMKIDPRASNIYQCRIKIRAHLIRYNTHVHISVCLMRNFVCVY